MRSTTVPTPTDLLDLVGADLGVSETHVVTREQIDLFANVTGDHQWIHVDSGALSGRGVLSRPLAGADLAVVAAAPGMIAICGKNV